jgi:hypothetical protein
VWQFHIRSLPDNGQSGVKQVERFFLILMFKTYVSMVETKLNESALFTEVNVSGHGHLLPSIRHEKTPWPESASKLYRPSDRRLSAKLVSTFADRGCHVVSAKDPYGRNLGFLDRTRYFFFQAARQLYSRS